MQNTAPMDLRVLTLPVHEEPPAPGGEPLGQQPRPSDGRPRRRRPRRRWAPVAAACLAGLLMGTGIGALGGASDLAQAREGTRVTDAARRAAETKARDAAEAQAQAESARADAETARGAAETATRAAQDARASVEAQLADAQRQVEGLEAQLSTAQAALAAVSASAAAATDASAKGSREVSYKNCSQVRDAGAAPIRRGDPGYSRKLDKNGDGIACRSD
jgi:hypothetical protein